LTDAEASGPIASDDFRGRAITTAIAEQSSNNPCLTVVVWVVAVFVPLLVAVEFVATVVVAVVAVVVVAVVVVGGGCVAVVTSVVVVGGGEVVVDGPVDDGSARTVAAVSKSSSPAVMPAITPCSRTDAQYCCCGDGSPFGARLCCVRGPVRGGSRGGRRGCR
jgi:hypothetical protein